MALSQEYIRKTKQPLHTHITTQDSQLLQSKLCSLPKTGGQGTVLTPATHTVWTERTCDLNQKLWRQPVTKRQSLIRAGDLLQRIGLIQGDNAVLTCWNG